MFKIHLSLLCYCPQIMGRPEDIDCKIRAFRSNISTQHKRTSVALLFSLALFLCLNPTTAVASEWVYTMKTGDNLWNLSIEHMGNIDNWQKLQQLNNVIDPKHIPPGTEIRFPLAWLKIKPTTVRILELTGEVSATSSQSGNAILLKPGTTLTAGDEIHTGSNGNVLLEFLDHSRLLLQKNSRLIFDTLNIYSSTNAIDVRVRLPHGRIETEINPAQKNGTRFEIHTPAAITGVRGTMFRVAMESHQKIGRTEVTRGKVAVNGATGGAVELLANFGTVIAVGQPPSAPRLLLPPPDLSRLPDQTGLFPLIFDWQAVDGAQSYRVQISHATAAGALLVDETALTTPQLPPVELPDGDYLIRVRAIDADGLEGVNAAHKFSLVVPIEPPLLLMPQRDANMHKQPPNFRWKTAKNATTYHFQLSTSSDFSALLIDMPNYQKNSLGSQQKFEPGEYYWRVASRTAFGKQSPFSPAQRFSLQPESGMGWMLFFFPLVLLL